MNTVNIQEFYSVDLFFTDMITIDGIHTHARTRTRTHTRARAQ